MNQPPIGTVTFLFTDIEGSTKLWQKHPDTMDEALRLHHALLNESITAHSGYVFQIIGDAFCAAFHTALDGLQAALAAQYALKEGRWGETGLLKVRMALHTGAVEVQPGEKTSGEYVSGITLSRSARLLSAGHGAQVLLSQATSDLLAYELPKNVRLIDLGEHRLKDLDRPEHIYQLAAENLEEQFPPLKTLDALPNNLPIQLTSFIGREEELKEISNTLSQPGSATRLITLLGPGGAGKTRLALQVAANLIDAFPDSAWFIELSALNDASLLPYELASPLGLREQPGQSILQILSDYLRLRTLLLVLDNCEHLVDSVARLADQFLRTSRGLKILATSREPLHLPGEWLFTVPALNIPTSTQLQSLDLELTSKFSAVELFSERARLVQPNFSLSPDNIQAVANICSQLDGLPLAIELFAVRIRLMSPQYLLASLNDNVTLYAGGLRTQTAHHRTLNNAIHWSYDLLLEEEKRLFARLSVFAGGFSFASAEEAFSPAFRDNSVSELIVSLADKSLLQLIADVQGAPRFNMLITIQQFAQQRLRESGEEAATRDQHLAYFLNLAEHADREMRGPDQVEWMDAVELEINNFRLALEWSVAKKDAGAALRLQAALGRSWRMRGHASEVQSWFDKICILPGIGDHPVEYARILNHIGTQYWLLGDFRKARAALEESQAIGLKAGPDGELGVAETFSQQGLICWSEGNHSAADAFFEKSFELYKKLGVQWGIASVMFSFGAVASDRNDDIRALSMLEQSHTIFQQLGDVWGMGRSSQLLGELFLKQGNVEKAHLFFDQHLLNDEKLQFKQGIVVALIDLGVLSRYQGDYGKAEQYYEKSLAVSREFGLKSNAINNLISLGYVALHRNDYLLAKRYFIDSFDKAWIAEGEYRAYDFLSGLAAVAAGMNQPERAARLSGAAQAILARTENRPTPFDQNEIERHIQIARQQIGDTAFDLYVAEGSKLTLEQAIEFAQK